MAEQKQQRKTTNTHRLRKKHKSNQTNKHDNKQQTTNANNIWYEQQNQTLSKQVDAIYKLIPIEGALEGYVGLGGLEVIYSLPEVATLALPLENTKDRYSWLCSLRQKFSEKRHFL